jgi:N-terminal acetyltransferase B complex catalytic subunit
MPYYMQYLARWPSLFIVAEAPGDHLIGYMMGKAEGQGEQWHGHVSAVTVAPEYRRLNMAGLLMERCEQLSEKYRGFFVDLYVRKSNAVAVGMYKKFGYVAYRQVIGYYSGEEDAYDMRKALSRDPQRKSMIPLPHPVHPNEADAVG